MTEKSHLIDYGSQNVQGITFSIPHKNPARGSDPRARFKAALAHLVISGLVAAFVALLVFLVWYPSHIRDMVGGRELFILVMGVDIVMGPLLTFVVFSNKKTFSHLAKDLAVIGALQLAALGFGLNTVLLARPVHINFEIDRLRVVTAAEIDPASLKDAPSALQTLPLWGPLRIASVKPKDPQAQLKSLDLALAGYDLHQQPVTWMAFNEERKSALWGAATPIDKLQTRWAKNVPALKKLNTAIFQLGDPKGLSTVKFRAIPILSTRASWTGIINEQGDLLATLDEDLF